MYKSTKKRERDLKYGYKKYKRINWVNKNAF